MNRKKFDSNLYVMTGFLFLIAGFLQGLNTFYILGCLMFVLAVKKGKK